MMRLILAGLAVLLLAPATAAAATLTVPGQYPTLTAAYNAAASGDTVQVAPGVYGPQTIPAGSKLVTFRGGPGVVLKPNSGGATATLTVDASNVTLDGINVNGSRFQRLGVQFGGAGNVYRNSVIEGVINEKGMLADADCVGCTLDTMTFRDIEMTPAGESAGVHMECLYSQAANLTIRDSRFENCAVMDVFFTRGTWWNQPEYGGWTLTNNFFGVPRRNNGTGTHYYSVYWAWQSRFDRAVLRGNTYEAGVAATGMNGEDVSFTNSVESCNTPPFALRGLVREPCGQVPPDPTPTPTVTPTPTPAATPTPTPTPTPAAYDPACRPDCDQVITDLRADLHLAQQAWETLRGVLEPLRAPG